MLDLDGNADCWRKVLARLMRKALWTRPLNGQLVDAMGAEAAG